MSRLQALLYKEWRDQRTLALGAVVLCVPLVVIARLVVGPQFDAQLRTATVLPACLGVFAIALATEAIARDAHNGIESSLAHLPASRTLPWFAKVIFVVASSLVCLLILALLESTLRFFEHHSALDGLVDMYQPAWWLVIAATAAACFASACVLKRSLPAALLGIGLVFAVPILAASLPIGRPTEWIDLVLGSWTPAALATLACAAFLLGSLFAFRMRRIDTFGFKRAAAAAMGAGIVLVPVVAGSARKSAWAFDILPFSKSAEVQSVAPSPDGRFVALGVRQMWTPRSDWLPLTSSRTGSGCRVRSEVWILDRTTGALMEIDDRFRAFPVDRPWTSDGRLMTVSVPGVFGDGDYEAERIDPSTGVVASSHPENEQDSLCYRDRGTEWCKRESHGDELVLRWESKGIKLRLPRERLNYPSPQPGIVFHEQAGFLVRHDLEPDTVTRLVELHSVGRSWMHISPDGRYLELFDGQDHEILDSTDGSVVHRFDFNSGLATWSQVPGRICIYRHGPNAWAALEDDRSVTVLPVQLDRCEELGRDHLIGFDDKHVECMKLDGSERQVLYEARP